MSLDDLIVDTKAGKKWDDLPALPPLEGNSAVDLGNSNTRAFQASHKGKTVKITRFKQQYITGLEDPRTGYRLNQPLDYLYELQIDGAVTPSDQTPELFECIILNRKP